MLKHLKIFPVAVLTICSQPFVSAQPDFFATIETNSAETRAEEAQQETVQYKAFVQQKIKYGLQTPDPSLNSGRDQPGINQIQTDAFGEWSGKLNSTISYRLGFKGEVQYMEWEQNQKEWRFNEEKLFLKNAFIDAVLDDGQWWRIGHQVFAWGESESMSISDVLSPYDLREFGQTEIRDIREPIPAAMYSLPINEHKLSVVATTHARANRYADRGQEFYPYAAFDNLGLVREEEDPDKQWELAFRYERYLNGGDISVVAAEVNDNDWYYVLPTPPSNIVYFEQARIKVLAVAVNKVLGPWQLKGELGIHKDKARNLDNGELVIEDQWRGMVGFEYSGINDWLFSYEINAIEVSNASVNMDEDNSLGQVLRIQHTAFNERLTQQLWYMDFFDDNGEVARWDLSYDWSDHWAFGAGVVIYRNANDSSVFYPFRYNDNVNFSATYHF